MLLFDIQLEVALEPLIYMLNLYNILINSYYLGKVMELLMKNHSLVSN